MLADIHAVTQMKYVSSKLIDVKNSLTLDSKNWHNQSSHKIQQLKVKLFKKYEVAIT